MKNITFRGHYRAIIANAIVLGAILLSAGAQAQTLNVALYPYVPRIDQFQAAITAAWSKVHPEVQLNFLKSEVWRDGHYVKVWDGGYEKDPPKEAHVYVFDAMFFEQFRTNNFLEAMKPSEIENPGDFLPYARQAVIVDGNYYAIPQLGCANILFYNVNDTPIANATTISQLQSATNQCTYTSEIPPDRRGLMLDMHGPVTNASLYLDIAHSVNGTYPLPQPTQPDATFIGDQKTMVNISSFWNINSKNPDGYIRGVWYSQGYGRAFMGFTETMSEMTPEALATINFKVMPLSNTTTKQPLFFVDAVGVNKPNVVNPVIRALAVELANLIAATGTVVASFEGTSPNQNPQYLMSVRESVFQNLEKRYPIYGRMHSLAQASNPLAFKLNASARTWLNEAGTKVSQQVRSNYVCGCDETADRTIMNNVDAQGVCPAVCAKYGAAWNGQWTNRPPAPGSVCGCNACPISLAN